MANPVVVLDDTLTDIADAIRSKTGGTATMTPSQMPVQIASIPSGGSVGVPREIDANGAYGYPTQPFAFSLPADATDIKSYGLHGAFYRSSSLASFSAPNLENISNGSYAFDGMCYACTTLTNISFPSLTSIGDANSNYGRESEYAFSGAFRECTGLTSVEFPELEAIYANNAFSNCFNNCSGIERVSFPKLRTIGARISSSGFFNSAFNCSNVNPYSSLTNVDFPVLASIRGNSVFESCFARANIEEIVFPALAVIEGGSTFKRAFTQSSITSISFPALTTSSFGTTYKSQFSDMLYYVTGCTVHFPAAIQSTVEAMTGYPDFGGTNTTVLFDL